MPLMRLWAVYKLTEYVVDQELSAKLETELQMEEEMRDSDRLPANIQDYIDNGPFEVSRLIST